MRVSPLCAAVVAGYGLHTDAGEAVSAPVRPAANDAPENLRDETGFRDDASLFETAADPGNGAVAGNRDAAVLELPYGKAVGTELEDVHEFLGVPYAAPPVRFKEAKEWVADFKKGRLDATTPTVCPQLPYDAVGMSEDCLHLNIYVPKGPPASADGRAALLFFHGGGLVRGSAAQINGSRLAAREGLVVVAANYRLGALGFAPTYLDGRHSGPALANLGYRDQREAMRWVRAHADALGVDPGRVTIAGQGSGARAVQAHVVSPGSEGLFARAIAQSADVESYITLEEGLSSTSEAAQRVGCVDAADLDCLRKADVEELLAAYKQLEGQVVGDDVLPQRPAELAATRVGEYETPLLVGANADEGNYFAFQGPSTEMTRAEADAIFEDVTPSHAKRMMALYGVDGTPSHGYRPVVGAAIGDMRFHCSDRRFLRGLDRGGHKKLWRSVFQRGSPCNSSDPRGAYHGVELPYLLGTVSSGCEPSEEDAALSRTLSAVWGAFARDGVPPKDMQWPAYDAKEEIAVPLDAGVSTESTVENQTLRGFRNEECDFMDESGLQNGNKLGTFVMNLHTGEPLHGRVHDYLMGNVSVMPVRRHSKAAAAAAVNARIMVAGTAMFFLFLAYTCYYRWRVAGRTVFPGSSRPAMQKRLRHAKAAPLGSAPLLGQQRVTSADKRRADESEWTTDGASDGDGQDETSDAPEDSAR